MSQAKRCSEAGLGSSKATEVSLVSCAYDKKVLDALNSMNYNCLSAIAVVDKVFKKLTIQGCHVVIFKQ